jgi:hypothetical protein
LEILWAFRKAFPIGAVVQNAERIRNRVPLGTLGLALKVIDDLRKMNQMQITTVLTGLCFALLLAALAAAPNLIAACLEFRAQKRGGAQQNLPELLGVQPAPVPFNYPPLFFGQVKQPENENEEEGEARKIAALVSTYPIPVPFNYPQTLTRSADVVKKQKG